MQGWKKQLLSLAWREVLLKAVEHKPSQHMLWVFSLYQKWICEELNAMMSKVWWGNQGSEKKKIIGWVGQSFANRNKSRGGLGFRDRQFNLALLAMMETSDLSRLLAISDIEIKILPFIRAELTSNVSYSMKSIMQAREVMKMGLRWRIGNGRLVHIWNDPFASYTYDFQGDISFKSAAHRYRLRPNRWEHYDMERGACE